jgi:hypothetical protein
MNGEKLVPLVYLQECFESREGILHWRQDRPAHHFSKRADYLTFQGKSAGKPAGRIDARGYRTIQIRYKGERMQFSAHRVTWALHYGTWPEQYIDHIDRNPKNNRIENLRDVSMAENNRNQARVNQWGKTGTTPAYGGRFMANIRLGGEQVYLGTFPTEDAAHAAYLGARATAIAATKARVIALPIREMADIDGCIPPSHRGGSTDA